MEIETRDALLSATRSLMTAAPQPKKHPTRKIIARIGDNTKRIGSRPEREHVAAGVNPDQVAEVQAVYRSHGLPHIEHTPDGTPICTENMFHKLWEARGFKTGRDGYDNVRTLTGRNPHIERERLRNSIDSGEFL